MVGFLEDVADQADDSVFGVKTAKNLQTSRKAGSFATTMEEPCPVCDGAHRPMRCQELKDAGIQGR